MILSKDSNNNWTPTAGGTGTFIGTAAAFNAIKATLPVNTVAYITDDGNGDLQPVDAVTNGDMHPVTSNAVYDKFAAKEGNLVLASGVTITGGGFARFEQSGNVVVLNFHGLTVTPTGTAWTLLGNLPSNINKPRYNLHVADVDRHIILIDVNGTLQLYSPGVTTQQIMNAGNATYIA